MVDGDGLAGGGGYPLVGSGIPPIELDSEGDFLIHGWGGGGRGEGDADQCFDVDVEDAARRRSFRAWRLKEILRAAMRCYAVGLVKQELHINTRS